jgi:hypothetical protein
MDAEADGSLASWIMVSFDLNDLTLYHGDHGWTYMPEK